MASVRRARPMRRVRHHRAFVAELCARSSTSRTVSARPRGRSSKLQPQTEAAGTEVGPEDVGTDISEKRTLQQRSVADAKAAYVAVEKKHGNDDHFDNKGQKIEIDAEVRVLRKSGRKCGEAQSSESQQMSADCFALADNIDDRQPFSTANKWSSKRWFCIPCRKQVWWRRSRKHD